MSLSVMRVEVETEVAAKDQRETYEVGVKLDLQSYQGNQKAIKLSPIGKTTLQDGN